jgi:ferredoxin
MKIRVDVELCTGHARCHALAPDVYPIDDNGYNAYRGQEVECPEGMEAEARLGAENCPEQAITLSP